MRERSGGAPGWRAVGVMLAMASFTLTGGIEAQPVRLIDLLDIGVPAGVLTRIRGSSLLANGNAASGARGVPVAGGGDLDDDGFHDVAFASVEAGPLGRDGAGEVIVVFGDGTFGGTRDTVGFAADRLKIAGQHAKEAVGVEVEIADVTGDGIADLLIGRQNHTPEVGRPGAGALTILVGGPELRDHAESLAYLDLGNIPAEITALTFVGASSYDRLGIWMRAGDVDGDLDGIADIVVGADEVDATVGMVALNNGAAYVIRGGAHLDSDGTADLADFGTMDFPSGLAGHVARVDPPTDSNKYHFGATCQIGDLDGDGKGEVIVGAGLNRSSAGIKLADAPPGTGEPMGGSTHPENPIDFIGSAFVVWDEHFPATAWTSGYTINLETATPVTRINGSPSSPPNPDNNSLGEELLAGLDYDGDGNPDLFIGDLAGNGGNGGFSGVGHVIFNVAQLKLTEEIGIDDLIASPPAGVRHTMILGTESGAIGADTALHGDYDGDGLGDLVFCNPDDSPQGRADAGSLQVLFGEEGGWPPVIDTAPADLPSPEAVRIVVIDGAHGTGEPGHGGGDVLCYSAASGDIDEDGVPDLLVNEMTGQGFADGTDLDTDPEPEDAPDVGNLLLINGASLVERVLLDVDGNGEAKPLTDGILILRFLSGFTDEALTLGALGTGATRDADEIEEYLSRAGAALDADADDTLQPLFDGVLAIRYLFGFEGAALVDGALDPEANRTDPAAVESFFDRLLPPP